MKNTLNRRQFLKLASAMTALAAVPRAVGAATTAPRVVVVGGGFGGATLAKYVRMWGGNVQVTLVDANPNHVSCILSNLVVTGALPMSRITLAFDSLKANHGVTVMQGRAVAIDAAGNTLTVSTSSGNKILPYDHLVLSPGIDFVPAAGNWNPNLTPHAWQAGAQTTLLKNQLAAMRSNDTFVMTVPKAPYRCPPGPYERACVVADYLKRKGRTGAKVVVLDANASITAEPEAFGHAFNVTHAGVIQHVPNATVLSVDSSTRSIVTSAKTVNNAKVLNYIPNQRAGAITAGLPLNSTGFVPVNPLTYGIAGYPNIHVIGDSCAVPSSDGKAVPKSGHMANSEAKICADAIIRSFTGEAPDEDIATSSACFSPITNKTSSWLSTNFIYGDIFDASGNVKGKGMQRIDAGEAEADMIDGDSYQDMFIWADSLFADSYS
ncbi:MAG: NAD(P)/FAD-dependent oxidoreductase [Gammaproteobacteria bacterium]|nr:NAD(P)/FAD-dependent oxidoreductase [Gammaproteobacteria bacterium]